jgi:hypothetical protein
MPRSFTRRWTPSLSFATIRGAPQTDVHIRHRLAIGAYRSKTIDRAASESPCHHFVGHVMPSLRDPRLNAGNGEQGTGNCESIQMELVPLDFCFAEPSCKRPGGQRRLEREVTSQPSEDVQPFQHDAPRLNCHALWPKSSKPRSNHVRVLELQRSSRTPKQTRRSSTLACTVRAGNDHNQRTGNLFLHVTTMLSRCTTSSYACGPMRERSSLVFLPTIFFASSAA